MPCPYCGHENQPQTPVCEACRLPLPVAAGEPPAPPPAEKSPDFCLVCGLALLRSDYQCARCGAPVGTRVSLDDPTASRFVTVGTPPILANTSGQRRAVPPELQRGWNWGAAFLSLFWAMAHNLWGYCGLTVGAFCLLFALMALNGASGGSGPANALASLYFLAYLAFWIGARLFLGTRGSALAWRNRAFQSVEHCRLTQAAWMPPGILAFLACLLLCALLIGAVFFAVAVAAGENS